MYVKNDILVEIYTQNLCPYCYPLCVSVSSYGSAYCHKTCLLENIIETGKSIYINTYSADFHILSVCL